MPSSILIVDDDAMVLEALSGMVKIRIDHVHVDTCGAATDALARIAEIDYDAIVSDIKMPGMDGLTLMQKVLEIRPATPTLLITGHGDHDLGVHALKSGAYAFIHKPIDRDYFIAWLKRAIQLRQISRQVEQQNQMLERTVQERTAELERANQELKAALEQQRESEEALRESEVRFGAIVNQVTTGIAQTDLTGRFLLVNQRYCDIVGYSQTELLQMRMQDITYPEDLPRNVELFERLANNGTDFIIEKRYVRKDGSLVWVNNSVAGILNAAGKTRYVVAVVLDVTDRKRAEEERAILLTREREARDEAETLNEVARTLAAELDLEKLVQAVTDAGTKLTGAQFGAFFYNVINEQGEAYLLYTLSGAPREAFEKFGLPRNTPVFEPTFRGTEKVVRSDDITQDPRYGTMSPHHGQPKGHLPVRSYLAVPVVSRSCEVLGGLFFGHPEPGIFTERAERLSVGIAAQAAIAIDNARLYEKAQQEITERKWAGIVEAGHRRVLELMAHDAPLAEVLEALVRTMEEQSRSGLLGSILLLDRDGVHLRHGAAPNLPDAYNQVIDGIAIGPEVGSCGTAAYSKQPVYVSDIATDPRWANFRELAHTHHLRACWSTPILSSHGDVLGTFAMYYRESREPNEDDLKVVEVATRTAAIAIERKHAEQAMALFVAIVTSSDDAIISKDLRGVITSWNKGAEQVFGYRAEEVVGRPVTLLIPPDRPDEEAAILERIKRGERIDHYETVRRCKDGRDIAISLKISPITDAMGRIIGASKIARDITERKRVEEALRENERRFREMIDALPAAIYTIDAEGRLTHFNTAAVEFSGRAPELGTDQWCVSWKLYCADGTPLPHDECPMALALKEGRIVRGVEAIAERPDGTRIWFTPYPTPLRDADGRIVGGINMLVDITERKRAEVLVDSQRQALQLLAEGAPLDEVLGFLTGVVERHSAGGLLASIVPLNEAGTHFQRGIGASLPDAFNATVEGVAVSSPSGLCANAVRRREAVAVHDFNQDTAWQPFAKFVAPYGLRSGWSTPIISSTGQMLGTFANYYCHAGDPTPKNRVLVDMVIRTAAVAIERKRAEKALRESEERYRALFESAPMAIFVCDRNAVIQHYNRRAVELWGREPTCGVEQHCGSVKLWLPDGTLLPHAQSPMVDVLRTGAPALNVEVSIERPDGSRLPVLVNFAALKNAQGDITGAITSFMDITERKRAEEALRESQARLQFTLESAAVGDWDLDLTNDTARRSLRHDQVFGYHEPIQEWGFETFIQHVHLEDRATIEQQFRDVVAKNEDWHFECRVMWPDGSVHWIEAHGSNYCDAGGKPVRMLGIVANITKRKQAEEALLENEERFRALVDASAQIVWTTDADGEAIDDSPSWRAFTGQTSEQWKGWGWLDALHPDDRDRVGALWRTAVGDKTPLNTAYRLRHVDGEWRWTAVRAVPLLNLDGSVRGWVGMNSDITERKRAEEEVRRLLQEVQARERELREKQDQLVQAGKLASLGELATGVAHEINNPLNNIGLIVGNLIDRFTARQIDATVTIADLHKVLAQVSRASKIITQVRTFGRAAGAHREPLAIHEVMRSALDLVREQFRLKNIEITLNLDRSNPMVLGNRLQLEQVFVNLLTNARDAMEDATEKALSISTVVQCERLHVHIADTGVGIPAELLPRIFDPFFTTKEVGQGTGLGLSISYSIIKEHQGIITADSRAGAGTTFSIDLPLAGC